VAAVTHGTRRPDVARRGGRQKTIRRLCWRGPTSELRQATISTEGKEGQGRKRGQGARRVGRLQPSQQAASHRLHGAAAGGAGMACPSNHACYRHLSLAPPATSSPAFCLMPTRSRLQPRHRFSRATHFARGHRCSSARLPTRFRAPGDTIRAARFVALVTAWCAGLMPRYRSAGTSGDTYHVSSRRFIRLVFGVLARTKHDWAQGGVYGQAVADMPSNRRIGLNGRVAAWATKT